MVDGIVGLLPRVIDAGEAGVTMDTLEGVTYLLQRMQVCARCVRACLFVRAWLCTRACASACACALCPPC